MDRVLSILGLLLAIIVLTAISVLLFLWFTSYGTLYALFVPVVLLVYLRASWVFLSGLDPAMESRPILVQLFAELFAGSFNLICLPGFLICKAFRDAFGSKKKDDTASNKWSKDDTQFQPLSCIERAPPVSRASCLTFGHKMRSISAEEWELLGFFEVEPDRQDPSSPWVGDDSAYLVVRGDTSLSCAIHPLHRDVSIILKFQDSTVYEFSAMGVLDVCVRKDIDVELLDIVLSPAHRIVVQVHPEIRVDESVEIET